MQIDHRSFHLASSLFQVVIESLQILRVRLVAEDDHGEGGPSPVDEVLVANQHVRCDSPICPDIQLVGNVPRHQVETLDDEVDQSIPLRKGGVLSPLMSVPDSHSGDLVLRGRISAVSVCIRQVLHDSTSHQTEHDVNVADTEELIVQEERGSRVIPMQVFDVNPEEIRVLHRWLEVGNGVQQREVIEAWRGLGELHDVEGCYNRALLPESADLSDGGLLEFPPSVVRPLEISEPSQQNPHSTSEGLNLASKLFLGRGQHVG